MRVFVIALVTMGAAAFSSRPTAPRFHIFRHAQCERSLAPSMSMSKRSKRRVNAKNRASVSLSRTPLSREFLVVLDFEATCEQSGDYEHEIIEWPAVLLRTSDATVIDEFHTVKTKSELAI